MADREYIWLPRDFAGGGDQAGALPLALVTDAGTQGPRIHYLHTDQRLRQPEDHLHMMTPSWGMDDLSEERQIDGSILAHHLKITLI